MAYISKGNTEVLDFYLKHGFQLSHDVFGGFIQVTIYPIVKQPDQ